jgi:hypothetical protein
VVSLSLPLGEMTTRQSDHTNSGDATAPKDIEFKKKKIEQKEKKKKYRVPISLFGGFLTLAPSPTAVPHVEKEASGVLEGVHTTWVQVGALTP